jgi:ADP-ribosylglycohydrolase
VRDVLDGEQTPAAFEPRLATTGYVVDSLQTALYVGLTAESAEAAIVDAVNRGGDTDTVGAITGALAGARFGMGAIPDRWTDEIDEADRLRQLARRLSTVQIQPLEQEHTLPDTDSLVTE